MALIYQSGKLNTTALSVPDVYIQISQPQDLITGGNSSKLGIVGTAGWGPVGHPVVLGSNADYLAAFGSKQNVVTDVGVALNVAAMQGATSFCAVRVTDGTDTVASVMADDVNIQAKWTGTEGNNIQLIVEQTMTGYDLVVSHLVLGSMVYSGKTWEDIQQAVQQDLSALITINLLETVPSLATGQWILSGGKDGGRPSTRQFLGSDGPQMTGMYALKGQGCSVAFLHGLTDSLSYADQAAFGQNENIYMIASGPSADTVSHAVSAKMALGLSSTALKLMFGDWVWYNDSDFGVILLSPQAFVGGLLATLSPEQSSLNKPLSGIIGTQKAGLSGSTSVYSSAELSALFTSGMDVICNPAPGGSYWAVRCGHNTSDNSVVNGDNYTKMTNYLAVSLASGMGVYVGHVINDTLFADIRSTLLGFLSALLSQGVLGIENNSLPYSVVCDASNNPQSRTALGYVQADVAVRYQGINEKFVINLQGGSSVRVFTSKGNI
ncbi:phage tail protein [Swingsia samuiensis]|uniref:Phage tail protein n=1 Tax=Swingsia samuiensis TaxID=1293412 RepID=A0A4Y6UJY4_9PROT|nr:phage tail protein [Swingsia samuiensis]QDH16786.1 phage tail protein [Swingsia samuiensis]